MENIAENILRNLFSDKRVTEFIETALGLSTRNSGPYLNYFGLNYNSESITSVKFYVAFFHRLQKEEIALLLPDPTDLYQYYDHWEESERITRDHSGCTFALKVSSDFSITNYFHLRLKGRSFGDPYFGGPNNIRLAMMELTQYAGVSFEYKNAQRLKRLYWYLTDPFNMSRVINRCDDQYFITSGTLPDFIEYTETEDWCKLINGIEDKDQLEAYLKFYSANSVLSEILKFSSDNKLRCACPGKYEGNEVRSIYLIDDGGDRIFRRNYASLSRMYNQYKG